MLRQALFQLVISLLALGTACQGSTLFQDATILTMAEGDKELNAGWMLVDKAGYIVALGGGEPTDSILRQAETTENLAGRVIMPGFLSGHSHLWQSAFRGIAPDGELWPWLNALHWTYGGDLIPDDLAAFTTLGALDQLLHGVTTTYNHSHWLEHGPEIYSEQFAAELKLPQRFVFSHCVDLAADPKDWRKQLEQQGLHNTPGPQNPLLGIAVNIRPYGSAKNFRDQVKLAEECQIGFQIHYLEQSARQEDERNRWPDFVAAGAVSPFATYAHFIHTTPDILTKAAEAGAGMIWNPLSNGRLGSGLANIPAYLEAGLKVGMGVDGQASADISDPFENMRMGLYATRIREENADSLQPADMLRLHTLATAKVLKVDKYVGSLEPGKFADFLVVDPALSPTGPVWNPYTHIVFACSAANIESVYIGGKPVVNRGSIIGHDLAGLSREVEERITTLRLRHESK